MILRKMSLYVLTWRQLVLLVLKMGVVLALTNRSYETVLQKNFRRPTSHHQALR